MKPCHLIIVALSVLLIGALLSGCEKESEDDCEDCDDSGSENDDDNDDDNDDNDDNDDVTSELEPPFNPYLADSPWPMSHRNPYCQGSSPYPGPESTDDLAISFEPGWPVSIFMLYTETDSLGKYAVWGSSLSRVYKIDATRTPLSTIAWVEKESGMGNPMAGAYTVLNNEGKLFVSRKNRLYTYENAIEGVTNSGIILTATYDVPEIDPGEAIIGMNMTYDGFIAFATSAGRVGVVSRDFTGLQILEPSSEEEELSNSIALDEDGGIYVVTSKKMYRIQWTGQELTLDTEQGAWSAAYESGPDVRPPGRLGVGSGTTPTLMGFGEQDKFVVIGDGQELMHLVLFWRDEIPENWEPIAAGKDRRIAAEVPITYGDASATNTSTEQSVLVRGYDAAVVSNYYGPHALPSFLAPALSNLPGYAPYGVEKFNWDPQARKLNSVWANPDLSCPNGVPSMSEASGLMYCIGQRNTNWTVEAIDWATGESDFHVFLGEPIHYNSFWAATEIGPDRNIITGTLLGTLDVRPR